MHAEPAPALLHYHDDSVIEIDNSAVERVQRGVAIYRSNNLFAGIDSGDERATAIYSPIGTIKLNGLDPGTELLHVLANIAAIWSIGSTSCPKTSPRSSLQPVRHATSQRCDAII